MTAWHDQAVGRWEELGTFHDFDGHDIFAVELGPGGAEAGEPLLVIHGFPTSSFDFAEVAMHLAADRRVVLLDLLGFGLSAKPDLPYTMALQADVVARVAAALSLNRFALLTHDMGDTVGGELLARQLEGRWPVEITKRVVTNGSIYIAMAHLTAGQNLLLSLPDELIPELAAPGREAIARSLVETLAPGHATVDMASHAELVEHRGGNRALARTIRYIEERRSNERRFTGAIETHPSPLKVVWGPEDPIAVAEMADRLKAARPDARLTWITGTGHYPQLEDPAAYLVAIREALA